MKPISIVGAQFGALIPRLIEGAVILVLLLYDIITSEILLLMPYLRSHSS